MPRSLPPQFPKGLKVLLVDTDESSPGVTAQLTQPELQYAVTCCGSRSDALALNKSGVATFDVVLAESELVAFDEFSGRSFIDAFDGTPVILMSESNVTDEVLRAVRMGAVDFLNKPLSLLKLKNIWQHHVRKMMQRTSLYDAPTGHQFSRPAYSEPAPQMQTRSLSTCMPSTMTAPMQPLGGFSPYNPETSGATSMKCSAPESTVITKANNNRSSVDSPGTPCGAEVADTVSAGSVGQPLDLCEPSSTLEGPERASFESVDVDFDLDTMMTNATETTTTTPASSFYLPHQPLQQPQQQQSTAPPMAAMAAVRAGPFAFTNKPSSFSPLLPVPPVSQWPRLDAGCVWGTPLGGPILPPLPNQTGLEGAPAPMGMSAPQQQPILIKKPAPLPVQPAPLTTNQVPMPEGFLAKDELAKAVSGPIGLRLKKSDSFLNLLNHTLGDDNAAATANNNNNAKQASYDGFRFGVAA